MLKTFAKAFLTLPYRVRFGSVGSGVRIMPPLMIEGAKGIHIGDRVIVEHFAGFSTIDGGEIRIGDDSELRCFSRFEAHDGFIRMGKRCGINPFTLLSGFGGLTIGDDVRVGSHCAILSSTHRFSSTKITIREQGVDKRPTVIGDDVWMGHACTIVGGVRIGDGVIVGAGAVVTHDIPAMSIAAGVPARVVGTRTDT